ncbi:MAG: ComF family protein [Chthoniobacteraceae bacterium]|nr:ComF family protein [Chthoniobacteraceae bacterium]
MLPPLFPLLRRAGTAVLDLLYPPHCAICRAATPSGEHLCAACRAQAPALKGTLCAVCSTPFSGQISGPFVCSSCLERHFAFTCAVSRYRSAGPVRELVHRLKYQRAVHLRGVLAGWLAEALGDPRLQDPPPDRLVPVPLHPARQRERGFNQARLLAETLSRRSGIPLSDCLRRVRFTPSQTRLDRKERMENLRDAFQLRQNCPVRNLHLLLIDDVLTTGSTVDACARVLREAGAASVRVATVARA